MSNLDFYLKKTRLDKLNMKGYSFGLIAFARTLLKGAKAGILTARSNRDGHDKFIKSIERLAGGKFQENMKYFVNDPHHSERLKWMGGDTWRRKLQILIEYRNGFKLFSDKIELRPISFDKVKLYEDEEKNINMTKPENLNHHIEEMKKFVNSWKDGKEKNKALNIIRNIKIDGIKTIDIRDFKFDKLDAQLRPSKNVLHMFDLDGTIATHKVYIYISDKNTGEMLFPMSQEMYATKLDQCIDKVKKEYPGRELTIDFSEFQKKELIDKQAKISSFKREN